jgi:hypothetical protein
MSLFGKIDDNDHRRWQARNLRAVTALVQFGVKHKLTPLSWRLPTIGTVTGVVDVFGDHHPREVFEAWYTALDKQRRVSPRPTGINRDGAARRERTDSLGQTKMLASFELEIAQRSERCEFVIIAEWFEDDITARLARKAAEVASA